MVHAPGGAAGRRTGRGATLLAAAALCAGLAGVARGEDRVFVPTFVDQQRQMVKPDLSGLQTLRFLTSSDYPPFDFKAPDGTLTGFNVDLARAICTVLKVTCSIQARGFDGLISSLKAQAGDAIVASLAMTEASRAEVDFSLPTMKMPARFSGRVGSAIASVEPDALAHAVIGVQQATAHEAYLRAFFPKAILKLYPDPGSLRAALKAGAVDLMFADGLSTGLWLNGVAAEGCCAFVGGPFTESRYSGKARASPSARATWRSGRRSTTP